MNQKKHGIDNTVIFYGPVCNCRHLSCGCCVQGEINATFSFSQCKLLQATVALSSNAKFDPSSVLSTRASQLLAAALLLQI